MLKHECVQFYHFISTYILFGIKTKQNNNLLLGGGRYRKNGLKIPEYKISLFINVKTSPLNIQTMTDRQTEVLLT